MKKEPTLMGRFFDGLMQRTDESLSFLFASLIILLFVVYPFFPKDGASAYLANAFFSCVLISSVLALPRGLKVLSLVLAGVAFILSWLTFANPNPILFAINMVVTICFLTFATLGVLSRVLAQGRVTRHRVQGAMAIYLMVGLVFGLVYSGLFLLDTEAFNLTRSLEAGSLRSQYDRISSDFVYYSFVTLTTVGYGDITPATTAAQQIAMLEALFGQLYPAVLLARLVSLELADGSR